MFSFHLFKRQANKRGIFLIFMFCIYAIALLFPTVKIVLTGSSWWWAGNLLLVLMIILSIITPVIALFKPGFSYKGHPGIRHSNLMIAGSISMIICTVTICINFMKVPNYLSPKQVILYGLAIPLHGIHCLIFYGSLFKGPTSKFGKLYQPYLPIIE